MGASGPHIKSGGNVRMTGASGGKMRDGSNTEKTIKSILGSCYICRENFSLHDAFDVEIRKSGKRYRRVSFHLSCDK